MDSPGPSGWPSDLEDQVAELSNERHTDQTAREYAYLQVNGHLYFSLNVETAGLPEVYADSNIASTSSLTEAQTQQLSQGFLNFSFFPTHSGGQSVVHEQQDIIAEPVPQQQSSDIQTFTDALQQQLQGLSKDIPGWGSLSQKTHLLSGVGAPSTVILSIDGTQQEIPISFHIDPAAALAAVHDQHEIPAETGELGETYTHFEEVTESYIKSEEQPGVSVHNQQQYPPQLQLSSAAQGDSPVKIVTFSLQNKPQDEVELETNPEGVVFHDVEPATIEMSSADISDTQYTIQKPTQVKPVSRSVTKIHTKQQTKPTASSKLNKEERGQETPKNENVRKSTRLQEQVSVVQKKNQVAIFDPCVEYNPQQLWCEDCQCSYSQECPHHKVAPLFDKPVLSRAWASLPSHLQIFRLTDTADPPELGVFCKKFIPKRTQFGPFIAETTESKEEKEPSNFPLSLEVEDKMSYLIATDENKCNWMMFVRPAEHQDEQNLVAYQHADNIYFTSTKPIQPKEELKVWYAAHYAQRWDMKPLAGNPNNTALVDEGRFECYECDKKLKSMAQLQQHLSEKHDNEGDHGNTQGDETMETEDEGEKQTKEGPNSSFTSWKKRKRNLYFNKIKKYRDIRSRQGSRTREGLKRLAPVYKCSHCPLLFDSATLLNIHTLMHAADRCEEGQGALVADGALQQLSAAAAQLQADSEEANTLAANGLSTECLKCPSCEQTFDSSDGLIRHTAVHARTRKLRQNRRNRLYNPQKPYQCPDCIKSFATEERLTRHRPVHSRDDSLKPLECEECHKRFLTPPALACHMKTHSQEKYYTCPVCREGFDQLHVLKEHGQTHATNGSFPCPDCHKVFLDFSSVKKHMRAYHPYKELPCPACSKVFPRIDKLKLHMLKHTDLREYMCDQCGRQFKRKDKLREHAKRMHDPHNPKTKRQYNPNAQPKERFTPKVPPSDYQRFIYKCHTCLLGFKRRGMLVNHLAKRHPGTKPDSIPELSMPILRTQRDYFCHYCDKVYKSSSKRKAHILKAHPGAVPPPGGRIVEEPVQNVYGINCTTYSQLTGSVAATAHACQYCHKQYASKPKLLQHQRKIHPLQVPPKKCVVSAVKPVLENVIEYDGPEDLEQKIVELHDLGGAIIVQPEGQTADILTQAMSELTHSFTTEYRGAAATQAPSDHKPASSSSTTEYQISLTGLGGGEASQATGILLQPTFVGGAGSTGTAAVDLSQILQEITGGSSQEEGSLSATAGGGGGSLSQQPIRIINQAQTLTVPLTFATQLLSRNVVQSVAK